MGREGEANAAFDRTRPAAPSAPKSFAKRNAARSVFSSTPWERDGSSVVLPVRYHLQEHSWSCGTASIKIVLDSMGRPTEERELIEISGAAPHHGTPPSAMRECLERLGVGHELTEPGSLAAIEASLRGLALCIVDYQAWGRRGSDYHGSRTGHYSVVYGFDRTHLYVADPAKGKRHPDKPSSWGRRRLRKDLFDARWHDRATDGTPTLRWMICVPMRQPCAGRVPM